MTEKRAILGNFAALLLAALLLCMPAWVSADSGAPYEANVYEMLEDGTIAVVDTLMTDSAYTVEEYMTPLPGTPWATRFPSSRQIELMRISYTKDGETRTGWLICNPEDLLTDVPTPTPAPDLSTAPVGLVLCESLSMRELPDTTAAVIRSLAYSDTFSILDEADGWYHISSGSGSMRREGYVKADYVLVQPTYYTSRGETAVYAYPSQDAPRVALLSSGDQCPIIAQFDGYTVVSLRGASGFVRN